MATRNEKDQEIQQLVEEIGSTSVFYLADTSELNAEATSQLRRECHKQGIRMRVVKNTLLRKALERIEERDYSELYDGLVGPTSILLAEKGNAPAKVIESFRKKHPKPVLKSAWVDEAVFIGDTLHDAEVAEEIGVDCLLVASGHQHPERLRSAGVPVAEDLGAVLDFLAR